MHWWITKPTCPCCSSAGPPRESPRRQGTRLVCLVREEGHRRRGGITAGRYASMTAAEIEQLLADGRKAASQGYAGPHFAQVIRRWSTAGSSRCSGAGSRLDAVPLPRNPITTCAEGSLPGRQNTTTIRRYSGNHVSWAHSRIWLDPRMGSNHLVPDIRRPELSPTYFPIHLWN